MTILYKIIGWLLLLSYWALIFDITLRILVKKRTVTLGWLLIIYTIPFIGIVLYFSFGEMYLGKSRTERARNMWPYRIQWLKELKIKYNIFATEHSEVSNSLFNLCRHRQGITETKGNQLKIINNANIVLESLINDISSARHNIDIVFYIWYPGGLADLVAESLIAASHRGVHCRLMLDSVGSVTFFRSSWPKIMIHAGIEVVEVLHISLLRVFLRRMDLRQHRKMILIDNNIAYTGSMNLADPLFFKQKLKVGPWIDLMVRIEGPVTITMSIIYACDWELETGQRIIPPLPNSKMINFKQDGHIVQVIASGPGFPGDMIHQTLLIAVYSARKQLIMTTPYFVPSDDLVNAICIAAYRGVEVCIIVPLYNNSLPVRWASRAFFTELLEAGVKIYQFKDGLLHTKSVLVDKQLSLIGTVNLDKRSLWLNFEIILVIDDDRFGEKLACIQNDYMCSSYLLDGNFWAKRAIWHRIIERIFYFFSPLL